MFFNFLNISYNNLNTSTERTMDLRNVIRLGLIKMKAGNKNSQTLKIKLSCTC